MSNEPPRKEEPARKRHPLEQAPPMPNPEQFRGQRVTLRLPVVQPYAIYALIAFNALIYVIASLTMSADQAGDFYLRMSSNQTAVLANGEYYRLLTAMFLHSLDIPFHIVFNMYALYAIGITVERFFGHTRFLIIYFLGGIAGSILSVILSGANVYSVGASGAIFAIIGAEIVFLYNHRKLFGQMARIQGQQLVIIALLNIGVGLISSLGSDGGGIDNWGHVGGFIGGLVLAWYIAPDLIPRRHPTQADALIVEDINPLNNERVRPVLIYSSVLLAILLAEKWLIA